MVFYNNYILYRKETAINAKWRNPVHYNDITTQQMLTTTGTLVHHATMRGDFNTVHALLQTCPGIDVNVSTEYYGWTPLFVAADSIYHVRILKLLLCVRGIDVNKASIKDGNTPLHVAAMAGNKRAVKLLFKKNGIEVNKENKIGWTPLDSAFENTKSNRDSIIELLKEHGGICGADLAAEN